MLKLILCDLSADLCNEWIKWFKDEQNVTIINDRFENVTEYDCIVSPANSFGLMDGGFDLALTKYFGEQLMKRVQNAIIHQYYGEQPVGTSLIVKTGNPNHPYLAHTPTMRVPMDISQTDNVYNAMRAMLIEVKKYPNISSVLCPGLGTLTGKMPYKKAAWQMYLAYMSIRNPLDHIDWDIAIERQRFLVSK